MSHRIIFKALVEWKGYGTNVALPYGDHAPKSDHVVTKVTKEGISLRRNLEPKGNYEKNWRNSQLRCMKLFTDMQRTGALWKSRFIAKS